MGNRRTNGRNSEDHLKDYADTDMEFPRLFALLLMVLEWSRPCLLTPLMRPICDIRVHKHFIQEARDAESAMRSCREGCGVSGSVTVPQPSVAWEVWGNKDVVLQAREVQSGLWLLQRALSALQPSVTNAALQNHIDTSIRNVQNTNAVLRSLNFQEYTPPDGAVEGEETWSVSSAAELLRVYADFMRGKVRLLLTAAQATQACQQDVS